MPYRYRTNGTLRTDAKQIEDGDRWATAEEWSAFQSRTDTEIVNGSVRLERYLSDTETWDTYEDEENSPGPWVKVGGSSFVDEDNPADGAYTEPMVFRVMGFYGYRLVRRDWPTGQPTKTFSVYIYDPNTSGAGAFSYYNENRDPLIFVGTNTPEILAEGENGNAVQVAPGVANRWSEIRTTFDWGASEATVEYGPADFTTPEGTETVPLRAVSPVNTGGMAFTRLFESSMWDGTQCDFYVDNVTVVV